MGKPVIFAYQKTTLCVIMDGGINSKTVIIFAVNMSLTASGLILKNNVFYTAAPEITQRELDSSLIPTNQVVAESDTLQRTIPLWFLQIGDYVTNDNVEEWVPLVQCIPVDSILEIIGQVLALNLQARTNDVVQLWRNLPLDTINNRRIFKEDFITALQRAISNTSGDVDEANEVTRTLGDYLTQDSLPDFVQYSRLFDSYLIMDNGALNDCLPQDVQYVNIEYLKSEAFNQILQPWIVDGILQCLRRSLHQKLTLDNPPKDVMQLNNAINSIFATLCEIHQASQKKTSSSIEFRQIAAQFINLAAVVKKASNQWFDAFLSCILEKDINTVINEFSNISVHLRALDIDPDKVAEIIVFLNSFIFDTTNEETAVTMKGAPCSKRKKMTLPNNVGTQLTQNSNQSKFFICKIRIRTIDPVFLIAYNQLSRQCKTNRLTPEERFKTVNLLYDDEAKTSFVNMFAERALARKHHQLPEDDQFAVGKGCQAKLHKLSHSEKEKIKQLALHKIIKYVSPLTFSTDNCSETSLNFFRNVDAHSALYLELVNRENYGINNVVCLVSNHI